MTSRLRSAVVAAALAAPVALVAQRAIDLTGTWAFAVVTENGTGTPTVTIKQQGDSLSGTYESGRMGIIPFKGTVKDSTFTFALNTGGGATLTFTGVLVNANSVKGDVDFGGQGGATFTGERKR
ncbi:MAG: hypothetical protein ACK6DP_06835 [Gemmatimonas sp.]|jgi:hypothetical protein|uniref:hypothetical protein n=1 Tax=Gemmatimonas sp. TaxID=1962908 RepID=UPI00391F2258|nr:hypothetical protein [Gemmatimonadota bacterium]